MANFLSVCRHPLAAFGAQAVSRESLPAERHENTPLWAPESSVMELTQSTTSDRPHFLAVIALYRMRPSDSASLATLNAAAAQLSSDLGALDILIYDNTSAADPQRPPELPDQVSYYASGHNDGVASAFNYGLVSALQRKCDWLITLDQDTSLHADFLDRVARVAQKIKHEPSIAAIVPQITGDGRMLSPNWFWAGAIPRWFPRGYIGIPPHHTFAFNSASVLRVNALRQIQGYSRSFWLDNSDSYLYHRLHLYGKKVFVAGDIQVDHQFSMLDRKNRMSISRYRNVLRSESFFWDTSMNRLAGIERTVRLIGRWCKQAVDRHSKELRKETALGIRRRLFSSRRSRVASWQRELELSQAELSQTSRENLESIQRVMQPRISVCMAARNGEKFIGEQVDSVLRQLRSGDELIIVDDASEDRTRDLVTDFHDDRLFLIRHECRQGIVRTFEHAIRSASGDIIFLCDQDDVWPANKVSRVTKVFFEHPEVPLVVTNLKVIDEDGRMSADQKAGNRRPFDARLLPNLFANRFQGSTMAFRSSLIQEVLPFPQGCHVLHDAWIGLRNTVAGGQCYYLNEDLLLYRRHLQNASHRLNIVQQILKRSRLILALALRQLRDKWACSEEVVIHRVW
ncbi:MAG TPA: glycosyltransferase [Candidatus Acidoferrum sp.]|nr:glycosyltransferase [Candidatus Acidoferrum sp.]